MSHVIYGLYSTKDFEVRYVGETDDTYRRLRQHTRALYRPSEVKKIKNWRLYNWIGNQLWSGHSVNLVEFETCDKRARRLRELVYMSKFSDLLNKQNAEVIGFYKEIDDDEAEKIRTTLNRERDRLANEKWNVGGWVGCPSSKPLGHLSL